MLWKVKSLSRLRLQQSKLRWHRNRDNSTNKRRLKLSTPRIEQVTTIGGEPFKELNIVLDNCGGQNKKKMFLWFLTFIVTKRKITSVARAIFLAGGHTQKAC
jgi:hypothetical protein